MAPTDQQEQLSLAALHATCAKAGFAFEASGRIVDNWGIDAHVHVRERLDPRSVLTDFPLRFQLKATHRSLTRTPQGHGFELDLRPYDHLRRSTEVDIPTYLLVYQMPEDPARWCEATAEDLRLRHGLRWCSLRGAPRSENQSSVTVYLPEAQRLTPDALRALARERSLVRWVNHDDPWPPQADPADPV